MISALIPAYSRMFRARPRPNVGRFTPRLGERVVMTRSPLSGGELIHTVVLIFGSVGALAGRFLIVSPSKNSRAACPSDTNVSGASQ
jgi:hypothetical protein